MALSFVRRPEGENFRAVSFLSFLYTKDSAHADHYENIFVSVGERNENV